MGLSPTFDLSPFNWGFNSLYPSPFFRFGIEDLISFRLLLLLLRINVRGFVNVIMYLSLVGRVNALNRYSLFVGY